MKREVQRGDVIICNRSYIETEFGNRNYWNSYGVSHNGVDPLTLFTKGKKYEVLGVISNTDNIVSQVEIQNDLGQRYWCDVTRFNTIKELRRQKLQKLRNAK